MTPPGHAGLTIANYAELPVDALLDQHARRTGIPVTVRGSHAAGSVRPTAMDDLATGGDLADIVLVTDDAVGVVVAHADRFMDLQEHGAVPDDALGWATVQGTTADGRVVAIPLTVAPTALCFRRDLLAEAGIAANRDALSAALADAGGGWAAYLDLGRRYHAATGRAWFDHPLPVWDAMVRQLPHGPSTEEQRHDVGTDPALRAAWDLLTAAIADGLSAHESLWDWDGGASFVDGAFATVVCPEWMLDVVDESVTAGGGTMPAGWDVAEVFPGGPVGWGSTFAAVSADAGDPRTALELVERLTDPGSLTHLRAAGGGLPGRGAALKELADDDEPRPGFGDAPVTGIFTRLAAVTVPHVFGPDDTRLAQEVFGQALEDVDRGHSDAETAWNAAVAQIDATTG